MENIKENLECGVIEKDLFRNIIEDIQHDLIIGEDKMRSIIEDIFEGGLNREESYTTIIGSVLEGQVEAEGEYAFRKKKIAPGIKRRMELYKTLAYFKELSKMEDLKYAS
jgi:hypothetical protein